MVTQLRRFFNIAEMISSIKRLYFLGITCPDPRTPFEQTGGLIRRYSPPFYVGNYVLFDCPDTHTLVGSANRTCQTTGQWSGRAPACDLKGC